jgi:DNA-binding transcriptional LysR family regulator
MIEPASLRYFREVAVQGSLRHAAERLYIAQSALSRQIRALEDDLGVALFERRARGMVLTAAGRLLLEYTDDSRARLEELRSRIQDFQSLRRGEVDIACVEGLLNGFMPEFVEEVQREHEGLVVRVAAMGSQSVAEAVAEHRFDLGILFGQPPRGDLVEIARMRQPLCVIVAPGHPLSDRRTCRLPDVAPFGVVMPDRSFGIRQLVDRLRAVERIDLRVVVETNTLAFAWRMVQRTGYVTFLPLDAVRSEVESGRLVALPLEERLLRDTRVTLVASPGRTLSAAASWTRDRLKESMAKAGHPGGRGRKRMR